MAAADHLINRCAWIPLEAARYYAGRYRVARDDLEQAGAEELVRAAHEWPGRGDFSLYAWTRVRRAIVDELRREHGHLFNRPATVPLEVAHHPKVTDDHVHEAHRVLVEVRRLPFRNRRAVMLRWAGWSWAEIGRDLGVSGVRAQGFADVARATLRRAA